MGLEVRVEPFQVSFLRLFLILSKDRFSSIVQTLLPHPESIQELLLSCYIANEGELQPAHDYVPMLRGRA